MSKAVTPSPKVETMLRLDEVGGTDYLVGCSQEQAQEYAAKCSGYNDFDGAKLLRLLKALDRHLPRMQYPGDNPNNGQRAHSYRIGAECSRVVYCNLRLDAVRDGDALATALRLIASALEPTKVDEVSAHYDPPSSYGGGLRLSYEQWQEWEDLNGRSGAALIEAAERAEKGHFALGTIPAGELSLRFWWD